MPRPAESTLVVCCLQTPAWASVCVQRSTNFHVIGISRVLPYRCRAQRSTACALLCWGHRQVIRIGCHDLDLLGHQHLRAAIGFVANANGLPDGGLHMLVCTPGVCPRQELTVIGCVRVLACDGLNGQQSGQIAERKFHQTEQQALATVRVPGDDVMPGIDGRRPPGRNA